MSGIDDDRTRWNARYAASGGQDGSDRVGDAEPVVVPPAALVRLIGLLPTGGTAVDLAGGDGGAALFLAGLGFRPVVVDVSDVALARAEQRAASADRRLHTLRLDLAKADLGSVLSDPMIAGRQEPVRLVTCFHYLQRDLLGSVAAHLPPGATFAAAIATTTNLERNARPSARFLLEAGELATLVMGDGGLDLIHHDEGWHGSDHHEAELVVHRPPE